MEGCDDYEDPSNLEKVTRNFLKPPTSSQASVSATFRSRSLRTTATFHGWWLTIIRIRIVIIIIIVIIITIIIITTTIIMALGIRTVWDLGV